MISGRFSPGETVYFVGNMHRIIEVVVLKYDGNWYTLKYKDSGGGVKLRENRFYRTREQAERHTREYIYTHR